MKGFRSYVYLLVETIRRTAQIDSDKGEAIRTRCARHVVEGGDRGPPCMRQVRAMVVVVVEPAL